jgi:hypothetical protein
MLHGNLSSGLTGLYKYLFLPVWSGVFGWGTFLLFTRPETVTFNGDKGGAPPGIEWVFLALWLLGTLVLTWLAVRLRWLRAYGNALYAGHFGREVPIQMDKVVSTTELWGRPLMIRIVYRGIDGRHRTVWFMPEFAWPSGKVDEHLLADLRALGSGSGQPAA